LSKQADIKVTMFHIPESSLDNVLISWKVSRSETPAGDIGVEVDSYGDERRQGELAEILFQDLPIREFVPVFLTIEGGSRSFWDQIDRSRIGWSFWEQSLRVRDLENNFEVVMPASFEGNVELIEAFNKDVEWLKSRYKYYAKLVSREDARWIVPLHIVTRGSAQANLRSILNLISTRTCYFSQASHWGPVTNGIIDGLRRCLPKLMERKGILRLPCDGMSACRFEKDLLDRVSDKSNPLCPIMIDKFCPEHLSRYMLVGEMLKRYPTYIEDSIAYCNRVGRDLDPELFK